MLTFDHTPVIYWALGYALAILMVGLNEKKQFPARVYGLFSILLFFLMRLPAIVFNRELNPDESQMISHALTLFQDPVYWRSVDGTTIGPLSIYPLILPKLFGLPIDYSTIRFTGALFNAATIYFFGRACLLWFGEKTARPAFLIPALFLGFTQEADFVHYSSEQVSLFLLAVCLWLLACISKQNRARLYSFLLGFTAGMIPFAKLQGVPQALVLAAGGAWLAFQLQDRKKSISALLALVAGGLTFPLLTFLWASCFGVLKDLFDFYIFGNVIYAGENNILDIPRLLVQILSLSPDFAVYTLVTLVPAAIALTKIRRPLPGSPGNRFLTVLSLAFALASLYAVTKSGNPFVHYLNYAIYPLAFIFVVSLRYTRLPARLWPALLIGWFAVHDGYTLYTERKLNRFFSTGADRLQKSPVVEELGKYTVPGDKMVIWGWQCRYYVEAQLAQGTTESHSERCIFDHPMRQIYRERYLGDIKRNKPAVFVDVVGKNSLWVQDSATQSYRSFPGLAAYIDQHYTMAGIPDGNRLFIRNDIYNK